MIKNKLIILILVFIPYVSSGLDLEYVPKDGVDIIGTRAPAFEGLT